ncbi:hypothetical protein [Streptomyces sp. NPDC002133]
MRIVSVTGPAKPLGLGGKHLEGTEDVLYQGQDPCAVIGGLHPAR